MRRLPLLLLFFSAACSQAQPDDAQTNSAPKGGDRKHNAAEAAAIPGLRQVGSLKGGVPESSGLAPAEKPGTYFTFGDGGTSPSLYRISATGALLGTIDLNTSNLDWESLSRDPEGTYYLGDCGNNNSARTDLRILRFHPDRPKEIGIIGFTYPDQTAWPPEKKKARNFDCEATLWHNHLIWLFTKDRGKGIASKVYTVPDQPGRHAAKLITTLNVPGEVTDAALAPSGQRLVLLGRGELFILDGNTWEAILKATPRHISLAGIGQTEGAVFKDEKTLLLSTEQGGLFEYQLP